MNATDSNTMPDPLHGPLHDLCPRCGYALAGLPDSGDCPECGRGYTPKTVERAKKEELAWRRNLSPRTIVALILLDAFATLPYALAAQHWNISKIDTALIALTIKVFVLDGLVLIGLLVIMVLSKRARPSRTQSVARWAIIGGITGAFVTITTGFFPDFFVRLPLIAFAFGIGLGGITGWTIQIGRAHV